jgi:hypothetical protein
MKYFFKIENWQKYVSCFSVRKQGSNADRYRKFYIEMLSVGKGSLHMSHWHTKWFQIKHKAANLLPKLVWHVSELKTKEDSVSPRYTHVVASWVNELLASACYSPTTDHRYLNRHGSVVKGQVDRLLVQLTRIGLGSTFATRMAQPLPQFKANAGLTSNTENTNVMSVNKVEQHILFKQRSLWFLD